MTVLRIVPNFAAPDPRAAKAFYQDILGLECVMDHGWIVTFAATGTMQPQVSVASEGGSGTPVPDVSVEVDDLDDVYARVQAQGFEIVYPMAREPWGVRRFYVRDPFGRVVNVLMHEV